MRIKGILFCTFHVFFLCVTNRHHPPHGKLLDFQGKGGGGALTGPAYPFLWGHPVVPIYGDISKNRHIAAYGKNVQILPFLRMRAKPQRVT